MKHEFNAQSTHARGRTLVAALYAAPAIILTAQSFGWMGFTVASAFIGGLMLNKNRRMKGLYFSRHPENYQPTEPHSTLQLLTNDLSRTMGIPAAQLHWQHPLSNSVASADNTDVAINPRFCFTTDSNRDELSFILAHELDHIRAKNDWVIPSALTLASNVFSGGYLTATVASIVNHHSSAHGTMTGLYLATSMLATLISLRQAKRVTEHAIEYRADSNALQVTSNLLSAKQSLEKAWNFLNPASSGSEPTSTFFRAVAFLTSSHPTLEQRYRNLDHTWRQMQHEAAKRAPGPANP